MTVVLMLIMSCPSFLFEPMDDPSLVMDASASPSEPADEDETMWLDSYYAGSWPTNYSQNTLKNGKVYKLAFEGTYSGWSSDTWLDEEDPPVGPFEDAPTYPSLAGGDQTGRVGADAFHGFACPMGEDYAKELGAWPIPWFWTVDISLDHGVTWSNDIWPEYNPTHKYEVMVVGKGEIIGFRIHDPNGYDDYGMLKIVISPALDTDEDGLIDDWEKDGIDIHFDGYIELDLPMLGADWEHKDIFVEADYMTGKAPNQDAIDDVKAAFYNAQVSNPDGVKGINLHVLIDEEIPFTESISFLKLPIFTDYYDLKETYFGTEDERLNDDTIQAKKMTHRYCIFANKIWLDAKCPGIAEGIPCDDFILAFGAFSDGVGSREYQAAVFMHELGHALGLDHGGNVSVNFKPNYLSIMNYAFQYNNYVPTRPLDYSYGNGYSIEENGIYEPQGIGQMKQTVWRGPNGTLFTNVPNIKAIDWNNNRTLDNGLLKINLNNWPDNPSPPDETLRDFDDWANLVYKFRGTPLYVASATPDDYHIELTTDQIEQMRQEAANIIVVDSPTVEDTDAGLPMEAVLGIVAVAAIVIVVAVFFFMRKKKK